MVGSMIEQLSTGQIEGLADQYSKDLQKEYSRQLAKRQKGTDQARMQRMTTQPKPKAPSNRGTIVDFGGPPSKSSTPQNPWSWTDSGDWLG